MSSTRRVHDTVIVRWLRSVRSHRAAVRSRETRAAPAELADDRRPRARRGRPRAGVRRVRGVRRKDRGHARLRDRRAKPGRSRFTSSSASASTPPAARLADVRPITELESSHDPARHPLYDVGFGAGDPVGDLHLAIDGGGVRAAVRRAAGSRRSAPPRSHARSITCCRASGELAVGAVSLLGDAAEPELLAELSSPANSTGRSTSCCTSCSRRGSIARRTRPRSCSATSAITYGELEAPRERARARADRARRRARSIVALICDRSIEMIVAIIGALKAGGAYLPIEPDAPADRVRYVLDDSRAAAVVTTSTYAPSIEHPHVVARRSLAARSASARVAAPRPRTSRTSSTRAARRGNRRACWSSIATSSTSCSPRRRTSRSARATR